MLKEVSGGNTLVQSTGQSPLHPQVVTLRPGIWGVWGGWGRPHVVRHHKKKAGLLRYNCLCPSRDVYIRKKKKGGERPKERKEKKIKMHRRLEGEKKERRGVERMWRGGAASRHAK